MGPFFEWACELHSNIQEESTIHYGVLAAVAAVLKHGKRDDLLPYAAKLLEWVTAQNYKNHKAMLVRKYGVKIVQRIGKCCFYYINLNIQNTTIFPTLRSFQILLIW